MAFGNVSSRRPAAGAGSWSMMSAGSRRRFQGLRRYPLHTLMAMRVSQVLALLSPRNCSLERQAFKNVSCTASSAR